MRRGDRADATAAIRELVERVTIIRSDPYKPSNSRSRPPSDTTRSLKGRAIKRPGLWGAGCGGEICSSTYRLNTHGQIVDGVFDILHSISGDRLDGVYQASVTLGPNAEAGLWQVQSLLLNDEARNSVYLSPANTTALEATSFTVTNSVSDTSPVTFSDATATYYQTYNGIGCRHK